MSDESDISCVECCEEVGESLPAKTPRSRRQFLSIALLAAPLVALPSTSFAQCACTCEGYCENTCQETCQLYCESECELNCQFECEVYYEGGCEDWQGCIPYCEIFWEVC